MASTMEFYSKIKDRLVGLTKEQTQKQFCLLAIEHNEFEAIPEEYRTEELKLFNFKVRQKHYINSLEDLIEKYQFHSIPVEHRTKELCQLAISHCKL